MTSFNIIKIIYKKKNTWFPKRIIIILLRHLLIFEVTKFQAIRLDTSGRLLVRAIQSVDVKTLYLTDIKIATFVPFK